MSKTLLLCAVLSTVCSKLLVLGDSNTCFGWPCWPGAWSWPDLVAAKLTQRDARWTVATYAMPGMTALLHRNEDGSEMTSPANGEPAYAGHRLNRMLEEQRVGDECANFLDPSAAPRLVLAVGTNDILASKPAEIVTGLLALKARAEAAVPCIKVYIALLPPRYQEGGWQPQINYVNLLLHQKVRTDRLIDFSTGFTPELYQTGDPLHLNTAGHTLQAERVLDLVFPEFAASVTR